MLQTEFPFTLPKGYIDPEGNLHREGTMRLATAMDEIIPMRDPRVQANEAYLTVMLLARVVTRLGTLRQINTGVIEGLFAADLNHLQNLYQQINENGDTRVEVVCPDCHHHFMMETPVAGG